MADKRRKVTVCDECLTAACWQGEFYCERAKEAGTVDLPVTTLERLALESHDYWTRFGYVDNDYHTNAPSKK